MKRYSKIVMLSFALLFMAGCDKGFEEVNTSPLPILDLSDPGLLFTNVLRNTSVAGNWMAESTIVQQFLLPYNTGNTLGFQFNDPSQNLNNGPWNVYTGNLRTIVHLAGLLKDTPRTNMYNETRIWKALHFMWLVDHYGDVPYFEAVRAQAPDNIYYPKYDKADVIYDDLYKELKESIAALDATKDNPSAWDIFVPAGTSAANQVAFWKKLGNSLLLRLGMRYTKVNPAKAQTIAQEAVAGGVMQTNADNAVIANMTTTGGAIIGYTNGNMNEIRGTNPYFYYVAKPFVDYLKSTSDPRTKFMIAKYSNPNTAPSNLNPDVALSSQFGFPIGYSTITINSSVPGFRSSTAAPALSTAAGVNGVNYSQINFNVVANQTSPLLVITNAQTKLLLADATKRGFLPGGDVQAELYYNAGIDASMDEYRVYPNVAATAVAATSSTAAIYAWPSDAEKLAYRTQPAVVYNPATALQQINTQYWVANFNNGYEAWNNFRRTGFPALQPNTFNSNLNGGFIRRFSYPIAEQINNTANYQAGVAALGGPDFLTTRIFWDIP
jgi:hypothetical protein